MATSKNSTVVGVFDDHETARRVVQALKKIGFTESEIGVARAGTHGGEVRTDRGDGVDDDESYSGEGALTGAVAGAGAGALWGLGILAGILPAIGPAIAGGTLAVLLSSAAAGAAAAGLAGALIGMGLSPDEAEYYETEMKAGRTIVTVQAGARRQEALNLIKEFGGYDISSRDSATRQTTAGSYTAGTESSSRMKDQTTTGKTMTGKTTQHTSGQTQAGMEGQTIQAREERLNVQKRPVSEGEVSVRKEVHTEHKTIDVPVTREEVVIERHRGHGQRASSEAFGEGNEIRVPVRSEEVDIQKETVVAEEVTVGKRRVQGTEHVDENLRKEEIRVEKHGDVDVRDKNKR